MYKRMALTFVLVPLLVVATSRANPNLKNITVKNVEDYTDVVFTLSKPASYTDFRMDKKIVLDLLEAGSELSGNSWTIQRGGIEGIILSHIPSASLTRIIIQCSDEFEYEIASPEKSLISLRLNTKTEPFTEWNAATIPQEKVKKEELEVTAPTPPLIKRGEISMRLENADLITVLRSIAQYSGMNMIIGDEVTGSITVELKNVDWEKALDLILRTKGYTYVIEINVIRVGMAETFAREMEKEEMSKPLSRKIFTLEFTTPIELEPTIKSVLSNRGKIESDTRTNSIIVTDIPSKLEVVEGMVKSLDKKTAQVAIASRIVDMDRSAARELGLSWQATNLRKADWNVEADATHETPPEPTSGLFLNIATVKNFAKLTARLAAMESRQRLKTMANPRITTVNNKEASIFGGKQFALTTMDIHGQPITRWYRAGIELKVTPHINSVGDITMDISVELSDVVTGATTPTITQTIAGTQSLVKDGETLVIGGFFTNTSTETRSGLPILKDLPLLGNLFGKTTTEVRTREVLIFITPHIVKGELEKKI
ncbi:MAG: secretin N-terminal domain-containing protein [candidate division WOR-3 bacterium]|nr:secretin N-terminal domain-containing protein [candidate division WOR-3 bacterium]